MSNYDHDQDLYDQDDDERSYEETVYNEEYYIPLSSVLERVIPRPKRNRRSISPRVKFLSDPSLKSSSVRKSYANVTLLATEELADEQRMALIDQFMRLWVLDAAFEFDLQIR
jgi:hypothetical protein